MNLTCTHCSRGFETGAAAVGSTCPHCGGDLAVSAPEETPPAPLVPASPRREFPLLQAFRGMNRNLRILGATAVVLLGGLAIFIASRRTGDTFRKRENVLNRTTNNAYFTRLIASGETTAEAFESVESLLPYGDGFIGLSKDALTWPAARELAERTGSEVLDLAVTARESRREFTDWLAHSHPALHGTTVWVRDNHASKVNWLAKNHPAGAGTRAYARGPETIKVIDCPDVLDATSLEQPRKVFLRWPKLDAWTHRGWTWTIPAKFDEATPFTEWGLARVRTGGAWGLIDRAGAFIQAPAFEVIEPFEEQGSARARQGEKWGLLDRNGKLAAKAEWEDVQHFINGFIPVKRDGKWGYLDAAGALLIACEWDDAWRFTPEGFAIVTRDGKRGFIDRTGKVIVEPIWDGAVDFAKEGLAMVRHRGGWGLIDTAGRLLGDPAWTTRWEESRFTSAFQGSGGDRKARWSDRRFDLGLLPMGGGGKWSLLRMDGNPVPDSNAKFVASGREGFTLNRDPGSKVIGADGKVIFEAGGSIRGPEFSTGKPQETGYRNNEGNIILPPSTGAKRLLNDRFVAFESDGKWGVIDMTGKVIARPEWDEIDRTPSGKAAAEGRISVRRGDKWGFIDETGRTIAEPAWREVGVFSEGFAAVRLAQPAVDAAPPAGQNKTALNLRLDAKIPIEWSFIDREGKPALGRRSWAMAKWRDDFSFTRYRAPRFMEGQLEFLEFTREGSEVAVQIDRHGKNLPASKRPPATTNYARHPGGLTLALRKRFSGYHDRYGKIGNDAWLVDMTGQPLLTGLNWSAGDPDIPFGDFIAYAMPPKVGLIDATGKVVVEPAWDEARILAPDRVWIRVGAKCGLADHTGKVLIEPAWDELEVLAVNSGSLSADGKSVLLGRGGMPILSPWVRVKDGATAKILRLDGKPAIPENLAGQEYVDFYGPAHLVMRKPDGQGGFVWSIYESATGDQVVFPEASTFRWNWNMAREGVIWMKDKATAEWRLFSRRAHDFGQRQPEIEKPDGWGFVEGRGILHGAGGWRYVDTKIEPISPDRWEKARDFSEGRGAVQREGKWGFIGVDGKVLIPPIWEDAQDFHRGLAAVCKDGRWGFIDPGGKLVIEAVWDQAQSFRKWLGEPAPDGAEVFLDVAEVRFNGAAALIDREGKLIVDPAKSFLTKNQSAIYNGKERLVVVQRSGKAIPEPLAWKNVMEVSPTRGWEIPPKDDAAAGWRLINEEGKPLGRTDWKEPFYDRKADPFAGGLITVRSQGSKYGLARRDGTIAVEPEYDRIAWIAPKVAAAWNRDSGGLLDASGQWLFRDNGKVRIARFGDKDSRTTEPDFRHGLVVIENIPKWGYARLNRTTPKQP